MTFDGSIGKEWKDLAEKKTLFIANLGEVGYGTVLVHCVEDSTKNSRLILDVEREEVLFEMKESATEEVLQVEVVDSDTFSRHFVVLKSYTSKASEVYQYYFDGIVWKNETILNESSVSTIKISKQLLRASGNHQGSREGV